MANYQLLVILWDTFLVVYKRSAWLVDHKSSYFIKMDPPLLFNFTKNILLTTLGIFELIVVYCPRSDDFHLTALGNSPENMSK